MSPGALILMLLTSAAGADPVQGESARPAEATAPAPAPETWTWSGIEILGNHQVPRAEIEKLIPIPIGGSYTMGEAPFWKDSCAAVERSFGFAKVQCGDVPLRWFDGRKVYLIVEVVERGNEKFMTFRDAPDGSVPFADPQMVSLANDLMKKVFAASMAGQFYQERGEKGYLSYTDPSGKNEDLSPIVEQLVRLVPPHRDNLFDVLRGEKDFKQRRWAATLLNWSGGDLDATIREAIRLLDDPETGVRNNLSRFTFQFVGGVDSKRLRHRMIDAFLFQIQRPSHEDRNKGITNLLMMAKASSDSLAYIHRHGIAPIRYLAENSILINVKGPAEELSALVESAD